MFPKEQLRLEEEVRASMKQENYAVALENLTVLLDHSCHSYANHIQILICWMRLKEWKKAERFCEDLLDDEQSPNYIDYMDYYLMILYEMANYHRVLTVLEEMEKENVPEAFLVKWEKLKKLSQKMNEWTARDLEDDFLRSAAEGDGARQYVLLQKWKQRGVDTPKSFCELLAEETVHPLVKTDILHKLQSEMIEEKIEVIKQGHLLSCVPADLISIQDYSAYRAVLSQLKEVEQNDPTGYDFMQEIYHQYCDVMYPLIHDEKDALLMAESLIAYVTSQFSGSTEEMDSPFMDELLRCQQVYLEVTMM